MRFFEWNSCVLFNPKGDRENNCALQYASFVISKFSVFSDNTCGVRLKCLATSQVFLFVFMDDLWFLNLTVNSVLVVRIFVGSGSTFNRLYIYKYIYFSQRKFLYLPWNSIVVIKSIRAPQKCIVICSTSGSLSRGWRRKKEVFDPRHWWRKNLAFSSYHTPTVESFSPPWTSFPSTWRCQNDIYRPPTQVESQLKILEKKIRTGSRFQEGCLCPYKLNKPLKNVCDWFYVRAAIWRPRSTWQAKVWPALEALLIR